MRAIRTALVVTLVLSGSSERWRYRRRRTRRFPRSATGTARSFRLAVGRRERASDRSAADASPLPDARDVLPELRWGGRDPWLHVVGRRPRACPCWERDRRAHAHPQAPPSPAPLEAGEADLRRPDEPVRARVLSELVRLSLRLCSTSVSRRSSGTAATTRAAGWVRPRLERVRHRAAVPVRRDDPSGEPLVHPHDRGAREGNTTFATLKSDAGREPGGTAEDGSRSSSTRSVRDATSTRHGRSSFAASCVGSARFAARVSVRAHHRAGDPRAGEARWVAPGRG